MSGCEHDVTAMLTVEQARDRLLGLLEGLSGVESVAPATAVGRVLAESVVATCDVPPCPVSLLDGYALRVADLARAGQTRLPVGQTIYAGAPGRPLREGEAARIFTGAPVPEGADAVIAQEAVAGRDAKSVAIDARLAPGAAIRPRAADVARGDEVLAGGLRLHPGHVAQLCSLGLAEVVVRRRPKVAVFTTGDELVTPGGRLAPGQIFNANHGFLLAALAALRVEIVDLGQVPDCPTALEARLREAAASADLILTSGGVSVGEADHVRAVVARLGQIDSWRVFLKPGKPLAFGRVGEVPFIGLPGNPVSTFATFFLFVRPALLKMAGARDCLPASMPVAAGFSTGQGGDRPEFMRVRRIQSLDGQWWLERFPNQNSGIVSSLSWADALALVPAGEPVREGQLLDCLFFSELFS